MAAVVDVASVRSFIRGLKATEDAELSALIDWVDGVLAAWLLWPTPSGGRGPTLGSSTYIDFLDGPYLDESRRLQLRMRPVTAVTEIADDDDWGYGASTVVDSGQYTLDGDAGAVWLNPAASHAWSSGKRVIKATYVAGFSAASPPYHVIEAMGLAVRQAWKLKTVAGLPNAAPVGDDLNRLGAVARSTAWNFLLPDEVKELMGQHRLWERACG